MRSSLLSSSSSSSSSMPMIQYASPCLPFQSSRKQHNFNLLPFSRHLLVTSSTSNRIRMEFGVSRCAVKRASKFLKHDLSDFITLRKSLVNNHLKRPHPNVGDSSAPNVSYNSLLTFVMLFGCFTLQGSQPALASSEFSNALQSITYLGDIGEIKTGFASAFLLIFFSELGDKTFFIAALLAARNSAPIVFLGTFGALASMTIISVALGRTFHYVDEILPFRFGETDLPLDDIAAVCLLLYFGVSTLIDATSGDGLKADEEQKEAELAVSDFAGNGAGVLAAASTVASTFLLVFVAEWGDKSFFSTIALAAASSPLGVIGGALAGHGVATLLAVLGGSLLGTFLSEKIIAYIGVGGVIGYIKSGSQKSLLAGGLSAALLYLVYSQLPAHPTFASAVGLGISAALLVVMGSRFKKSGKIFPAGVVSLVSFVMTGGYVHGIMRGMH